MNPLLLIVIVAMIFAVLFVAGFALPPPDPVAQLKREYVAMMRLGPSEGRRHLQQRLEALRDQKPGRTQLWYLTWLVDDLRRVKRG